MILFFKGGNYMEKEIWKDIEGFDGEYQVSTEGRVKSLKHNKERILKQSIASNGYYMVNLWKNNVMKAYLVHQLVAKAHIPNPNNYQWIEHIDTDKLRNKASNLRWSSTKEIRNKEETREKISKGNKNKKIENPVKMNTPIYCFETDTIYKSQSEAARILNISPHTLNKMLRGHNKRAEGYTFCYAHELANKNK